MENLLLGIFAPLALGWVAWVSLSIIKNSNNREDFTDLKRSFHEMEDRVNKGLSDINLRQDNFIKAEIQELKTLFEK